MFLYVREFCIYFFNLARFWFFMFVCFVFTFLFDSLLFLYECEFWCMKVLYLPLLIWLSFVSVCMWVLYLLFYLTLFCFWYVREFCIYFLILLFFVSVCLWALYLRLYLTLFCFCMYVSFLFSFLFDSH